MDTRHGGASARWGSRSSPKKDLEPPKSSNEKLEILQELYVETVESLFVRVHLAPQGPKP